MNQRTSIAKYAILIFASLAGTGLVLAIWSFFHINLIEAHPGFVDLRCETRGGGGSKTVDNMTWIKTSEGNEITYDESSRMLIVNDKLYDRIGYSDSVLVHPDGTVEITSPGGR